MNKKSVLKVSYQGKSGITSVETEPVSKHEENRIQSGACLRGFSKNATVPGFAKTDCRYWKTRLFKNSNVRNGIRYYGAHWCIKIKHGGRRETVNLRTANQAAAAQRAAEFFKGLLRRGWGDMLAEWKPKPVEVPTPATVGEFIAAAAAICSARATTVWEYGVSLRRIAADVAGISRDDPRKWAGRTGGAQVWREKVDALPLDILTPEAVQRWRLARVKPLSDNPLALRAMKTTVNSTLRKAKSLFSPKITRHIGRGLILPPNPFHEAEFFERPSMRYHSKINAPELIAAARTELGGDMAWLECWKAFVLLMFAGLRKNEADKLRWASVDFTAGLIRIEDHESFQAKCEASKDAVEIDGEVAALLKKWRALDPQGSYVLRSPLAPILVGRRRHYRAPRTFAALADWLKTKGVTARKALHELRKEAGSLVAQRHGIYAASRFLRHANISTTSAHYLDKKERVTLGLGALLGDDSTAPELVKPSKPMKTGAHTKEHRRCAA